MDAYACSGNPPKGVECCHHSMVDYLDSTLHLSLLRVGSREVTMNELSRKGRSAQDVEDGEYTVVAQRGQASHLLSLIHSPPKSTCLARSVSVKGNAMKTVDC
jgi:hypothetical protein